MSISSRIGLLLVLVCCGPACARRSHRAAPAPRYGEVMIAVGQRFERAGRAAAAGNWELASYDLHEIEESFEDDLTRATQPPEVKTDLRPFIKAFLDTHPAELTKAAEAHDREAFAAAFAHAANTCNGCHRAASHAFIVVPGEVGAPVPQLAPPASSN